ncbi:peptidase S8/S53 domain-containing protein [Phascolomyces articulosus]|uniref:Peptidase S8/S53 domain-containing protein n=1 Tax=Phascolomyces articulosus TaxID=60185 RepID=A0AAD5PFM4_9FUNG|nr:peptidase S8/S53 domain-containing protein [Phascolomyces articulosus]
MSSAAKDSPSSSKLDTPLFNAFVPGRYMFEFGGSDADTDGKKVLDLLKGKFNQDADFSLDRIFDHEFIKGATFQIDQKKNHDSVYENIVKAVSDSGLVSKVYPVRLIERPKTFSSSSSSSDGATDLSRLIPHAQTQVDRVHKELKNTGKGITVGIIDSGIDYMHPALGGGFGEGYKVRYGRDLAGDEYDGAGQFGSTTPKPDDDPLDNCPPSFSGPGGHGTHVAGIIAGKADNFTGVAPDSTLGMWRIFGCNSLGSGEDLITQALLEAYDAGVDIISMSVGGLSGWNETSTARVAAHITAQGVPVVISAGNSGDLGVFTMSDGPLGEGVFGVASFDNDYKYVTTVKVGGSSASYGYSKTDDTIPNGQLVAGDKNAGSGSDACDASTVPKNVKGKLALVQSTHACPPNLQAGNLEKAGAIGIVFFGLNDMVIPPQTELANIPTVGIAQEAGQSLLAIIEKEVKVSLTFNIEKEFYRIPTGNTVSSFSSMGPSNELALSPAISGVGGYIISTLPQTIGSWGMMSGTSMAAPYVSGSIALYLKSLEGKKTTPAYVLEQFSNYAYKAPSDNTKDDVETPCRQGAGLVQVYDAIKQQVHVAPAAISFNDTANLLKTHTLTITNHGDSIASYELYNNVSVSIIPYAGNNDFQFTEPATFGTEAAKLKFSKKTIKLSPGKSVQVKVTVMPPKTNPAEHIMYSGYVQLTSGTKENKDITVPYVGIVGNQRDIPVFGQGTPILTNGTGPNVPVFGPNDTYVFDRSDVIQPIISAYLNVPAKEIKFPLFNDNGKEIGRAFSDANLYSRSYGGQPSISMKWNGTYLPTVFDIEFPLAVSLLPGEYHLGISVLKWLGNPDDEKDWETWASGPIQIK